MRLGLIADVHEAADLLREALEVFRRREVDEVLFLGDLCCANERLGESARLLAEAGVPGVWGNHDFGLCRDLDEAVRARFGPEVLAYMGTLKPTLVRDDCHFSHVEPWLDANDLAQLWYFEGLPDTPAKLARCFGAVPQRVLMSGHVHRWFLASPEGVIDWDGTAPVCLRPPGRYYLTVHALVEGHGALYDTTTGELEPIRLGGRPS